MRLMCQGRPSRVMRQGSGPGPAHPSITPPVMRPALVPVSPLPDLSLPVSFPRLQVISLAVVVSLIVAVTSPSVTAPPGLMVQVAAAAAGPAARPAARQAAMPVSGIRTEREKVGNRIGRAYGGRPDPSRPRPAQAADPPLRPVVVGLALVFQFSHEVPGVIGLPRSHGHDPLVLDDTFAWASVRKCP